MGKEILQDKSAILKNIKTKIKDMLEPLEAILDKYMVEKTPFALPFNLKNFIVTASPYLVVIFIFLILRYIFFMTGLLSAFIPSMMTGGWGFSWGFFDIVILLFVFIVLIMAIRAVPGLFKRTKISWRLLFYMSVLIFVGNVLFARDVFTVIIWVVLSWYILFQVKDMYKN